MAYATVADVVELHSARTFTGSSRPTTDQVVDFLEQTAAEIDGLLRAKNYSLPIPTTATSALKLLEGINAKGGHAHVEQGAQNSDRKDAAMKMWESAKKALRCGELQLEAPLDVASSRPRANTAASAIVSLISEF